MAKRDVITIGASAGGIEALTKFVQTLPKDFPAAIFLVLHISPDGPGLLPQILSRKGPLPAVHPKDGEEIRTGRIYVAPPNHHLIVERGYMTLSLGPKENRHRPAIDPLFRSASKSYEKRVIGMVLSGMLDDGSNGLVTIKRRGGICIVQNPTEAFCPDMPRNAMANAEIDHVLTVAEMVPVLSKLIAEEVEERSDLAMSTRHEKESARAMEGERPITPGEIGGELVPITCPDCGGNLWKTTEGKGLLRYQCHVGHAYSPQSLLVSNSDALEEALWIALKTLQERISICRDYAKLPRLGADGTSKHFENEAEGLEARAVLLRKVLQQGELFDAVQAPIDQSAQNEQLE